MKIVPVIDVSRDRAVLAERGRRAHYRPLQSPLCPSGDPFELVRALHVHQRFPIIYLADLDAIQGVGSHAALLARIRAACPGLELWVDGGCRTAADVAALRSVRNLLPVIGSETWTDTGALPGDGLVLSVDSDGGRARDPSGICDDPARWPQSLILMNLARVGSRAGPDLGLLRAWQQKAPGVALYLAGGVRDTADLRAARDAGAQGVLVATALHEGRLHGVVHGVFD